MIASHLLRILQTRPTHVKHETSSSGTSEPKSTRKKYNNHILCPLNGDGWCTNPLTTEIKVKDGKWNNPVSEVVFDDFCNFHENEVKDHVASNTICTKSTKNESDLYTDRGVMECDLPELIVCCKESSCHGVKDICVDEGVPLEKKILVESVVDNSKTLPSSGGNNSDIAKEFQDKLRSSSHRDHHGDDSTPLPLEIKILVESVVNDSNSLPFNKGNNSDMAEEFQDKLRSSSCRDCHEDDSNSLPLENKILVESVVDDSTRLLSNGGDNSDMAKEFQDRLRSLSYRDCDEDVAECKKNGKEAIDFLTPDGQNSWCVDFDQEATCAYDDGKLKSSSESDNDQDVASQCGANDLIHTCEKNSNASEKIVDDTSGEELISNSMLVKEFGKETSLEFLLESSKYSDNDVSQLTDQNSCAQAFSKDSAEESKNTCLGDNLFSNRKVETGIIITNIESYKLPASSRDENPENVQEQKLISEKAPSGDDGILDDFAETSQAKHGERRESNLYVSDDVVPHPGSIPFSGSISIRSDSSTTSTRSFAFPILQSEWNSSPVRMVKADQRHFRKHRGWRDGLLCCRF